VNERLEENRPRLIVPGHEGLINHLQSLNEQVHNIAHPREFAIDTSIIRRVAEMGTQQAEGIRIDTFDKEEFMKKLFTEMGGHKRSVLDWSSLGCKSLPIFKCSPDIEFMYGSLNLTPRVRTLRKMSRQERPQASETTRPSEVQQTGDVEEATTKDVQNLLQHLRAALKESQRNAVHYFKFLVHPTSFSQTVENIFHLSFLIKDGRVALELIDGQPYISIPKSVATSGQSTKSTRKQAILRIDMSLWQEIIDLYQITEPMIRPIEH
jgi:hypothetical protein